MSFLNYIYIYKDSIVPISISSLTNSNFLLSYLYRLCGNQNTITYDAYFLEFTSHIHLLCVFDIDIIVFVNSSKGFFGSGGEVVSVMMVLFYFMLSYEEEYQRLGQLWNTIYWIITTVKSINICYSNNSVIFWP